MIYNYFVIKGQSSWPPDVIWFRTAPRMTGHICVTNTSKISYSSTETYVWGQHYCPLKQTPHHLWLQFEHLYTVLPWHVDFAPETMFGWVNFLHWSHVGIFLKQRKLEENSSASMIEEQGKTTGFQTNKTNTVASYMLHICRVFALFSIETFTVSTPLLPNHTIPYTLLYRFRVIPYIG